MQRLELGRIAAQSLDQQVVQEAGTAGRGPVQPALVQQHVQLLVVGFGGEVLRHLQKCRTVTVLGQRPQRFGRLAQTTGTQRCGEFLLIGGIAEGGGKFRKLGRIAVARVLEQRGKGIGMALEAAIVQQAFHRAGSVVEGVGQIDQLGRIALAALAGKG